MRECQIEDLSRHIRALGVPTTKTTAESAYNCSNPLFPMQIREGVVRQWPAPGALKDQAGAVSTLAASLPTAFFDGHADLVVAGAHDNRSPEPRLRQSDPALKPLAASGLCRNRADTNPPAGFAQEIERESKG